MKGDFKMKTVVFIETNFSGLDAIVYCKNQGYRVVLVTDSFERFRKWFPTASLSKLDLVDQVVEVNDSNDFEEVRAALQREVKSIDALMTYAEIRTLNTARLCAALGLRGTNPQAVEIAQDKHRFRRVLRERGVDTVWSDRVDSVERLSAMRDQIRFPCFIKPLQGHSSIGSVVCRDASDIEALVPSLSRITEDWISRTFVVEDYLEGALVSVEILTTGPGEHQVVGVSDRDIVNDCVEVGAAFPLIDEQCTAVVRKACAALDAIGFDFGASHVELIVTAEGPHLVEVNTRPGGSGHTVMLDLSTGRSIVGDCIELALGTLTVGAPLYGFEQGAAWRCFTSSKPGTIMRLPPPEAVKSNEGVREVWYHHEQGDEISELNSNFSWIIQVMCTGKDRLEAKLNAARAIKFIELQTIIA
jgi:biotin carboxylase